MFGEKKIVRKNLTRIQQVEELFRGHDYYPNIVSKIAIYIVREGVLLRHIYLAKVARMKLDDSIIKEYTSKIKNTRLARKVHKDRIVKNYKEDEEWIRILKQGI
jgi:hypothetical protein